MFLHYLINREFIVSETASRVYRAAATLSVSLFYFIALIIAMHVAGARIPGVALPIVKLLLFVGVMGAAVTMVGMEYFLFDFDRSSANRRVFWFAVMLFPLLGAPLYCFRVYSRSEVVNSSMSHSEANPAPTRFTGQREP
jgi:hypothetical protein